MHNYNRESLLAILRQYEEAYGELPTQRSLRKNLNISEDPFYRVFGSWSKALGAYVEWKTEKEADDFSVPYITTYDSIGDCLVDVTKYLHEQVRSFKVITKPSKELGTSLVIPDAHIAPNQDLNRFTRAGRLAADKRPDRIIFMGDFTTLESLSNWDINKSGVMEGKRYSEDVKSAKEALRLFFSELGDGGSYQPHLVFIKGNHENRLDRYLDTKPELKEHLNLENDLELAKFGFHDVVNYRGSIEFAGTVFTHAPQNAANQAVSGKYAIHRAAEMTAKSLVFAHTHRKESINYYRHGSGELTQILTTGAFFEHTEDYAYGGLNAYWRGLVWLNHWKFGRFDVEEISLERLKQMYGES